MKMKHIYYISCFHTNILHIKSSWIHVMKHSVSCVNVSHIRMLKKSLPHHATLNCIMSHEHKP